MNVPVYTVGIVVDTHFGSRIEQLAQKMPIWVVDTPVNRAAAEQFWRKNSSFTHMQEVTTFKVDLDGTPNDWCCAILLTVDLHHGEYSQNPPYRSVVVIGTDLSADLRAIFENYGFRDFREEGQGFRCSAEKTSV